MPPRRAVNPRQLFNPNNLNPLSRSLLENFGKDKRLRRRDRWAQDDAPSFKRADIVDEKACDDIVQYLAPSLEQHKGCSIIDVHPGACLFSQKIHEFLKPKWHLLMEPEGRYQPYIKPLVDRPGSTYCHTYLAGAHPKRYWESYRQLHEDPTLLPPRPALPIGDPDLRKFDPSLLVIGNLERTYVSAGSGRIDIGFLLLHQMSYGVLANELFQRSGLVRMLWWFPERMKRQVLPRNPMLKSAFSHGVEMGTKHTEVAGVTPVQTLQDATFQSRKRLSQYDRLGIDQVAQRMQKNGISPPKGRELLGVDYEKDVQTSDFAHKSPFEALAKTPAEIRRKIARARETMKQRIPNGPLAYPQVAPMLDALRQSRNFRTTKAIVVTDAALQILHLEASYKELEEKSSDQNTLATLKAEIAQLEDDLREPIKGTEHMDVMNDVVDETVAFYVPGQHLAFERREYEPLQLHSTDFFPPGNDLTLVDFQPRTRDLSVPGLADNREATKVCQEMLRALYATKNRSVIDTLNTFAVNAGNDLVPMVPEIYDARKGGRLNPRNLRVKMLTNEMVEGLVKAFFEWPFRPQTWEITGVGDGEGSSVGETEGEGKEGEEDAA